MNIKSTQPNKSLKTYFYLNLLIRATLVIAFALAVYEQNWMAMFVSALTFVLTFLPQAFERQYKINLPTEIQAVIIFFIYAGIFLGEVQEFYTRFWWWDSLLHALSGVALGFAGVLIMYVLHRSGRLKTSFSLMAVLAFCFAIALGTMWEIFEFLMDSFFSLDMQKARNLEGVYGRFDTRLGVIDTMLDLILNTIGATIASVAGYFYLKGGDIPIYNRIIKKFESENPHLFTEAEK